MGPTPFTLSLPFARTARGRLAIDDHLHVLTPPEMDEVRAQGLPWPVLLKRPDLPAAAPLQAMGLLLALFTRLLRAAHPMCSHPWLTAVGPCAWAGGPRHRSQGHARRECMFSFGVGGHAAGWNVVPLVSLSWPIGPRRLHIAVLMQALPCL